MGSPLSSTMECADTLHSSLQQLKRTIVLVGLKPSKYTEMVAVIAGLCLPVKSQGRGAVGAMKRFKMEKLQYSASSHKEDHAKIRSTSIKH